ncbi:unnamed protein product [Acanthoscelides obtectus]|uniref:Uncharacterized protein n=1 Tax=Acanthoscelides obtectus TaxID=200917 RepID=A0A9P0KSN5_ACAOB|nr:unnamed protein product [Acanthoscelides obtectus]CAK1654845.1 hypothetical protein AOBTE_LOCUS18893 [Acanthoscelides obtectus]
MAEFMPTYQPTNVFKDRRELKEVEYRALYRFSKVNVEWISNHFLGETEEYRGGALSNIERMRVFLRYVGDPGFQIGIGEAIGVHQSTASRTVSNVITRIVRRAFGLDSQPHVKIYTMLKMSGKKSSIFLQLLVL